jgi:hypothetical protein
MTDLNRETFKAFLRPDDIGGLTARFSTSSMSAKILNEDFCRVEESLVDVLAAALLLRYLRSIPSAIGGPSRPGKS